MRKIVAFILLALSMATCGYAMAADNNAPASNRKERKAIIQGNKYYKQSKYSEALKSYTEALKYNPSSIVATYNLGLANLRMAADKNVKEEDRKKYEAEGKRGMQAVEQAGSVNPNLAGRAAYNLGNVAFNSEDYQSALGHYKQALRFNPDDNEARRNLRITQKKLQNQNQNKDKNKDKDKKDQDKKDQDKKDQDKKDQDKKDQDKNQDKNQDKQPPKTPDNQISEQTADQILKAMENKEAQTRARVMNPDKENKQNQRTNSRKNW